MLVMVSFGMKSIKSQAQCGTNLVPNPSFEDYIQCPVMESQFGVVSIWTRFRNSAEYFNACDVSGNVGVPSNMAGYQQAASGQAYAGINTFSNSGVNPSFRDYIGVQLISPLVIGTKYYVSFKVSPTLIGFPPFVSDKYVSNKLGVLFTNTASSNYPIPNFAHVYSDSIISDTTAWATINGSFIADTTYQYIVIGNFFHDSLTAYININPSGMWHLAYYYVDDVCVSTDSLVCASFSLSCDDNDLCTFDSCVNGQCIFSPIVCNDINACTVNLCDSFSGCIYIPADCSDNNICTIDSCDSIIGCTYDSVNCDDNYVCTKDICDALAGCLYSALNCDDYNFCTIDICDSISGCFYSTVNCNDNDSCTIDNCDSLTGCIYLPDTNCINGITSHQFEIPAIYPNPTSALITIESFAQILSVHIYDALGQLVASMNNGQKNHLITLNLSEQLPGIYIVSIETEKSFFKHKIFLNH